MMSSQQKSCQLVEQLLQVLGDEVDSLSEQTIETMQQRLCEALSTLRSTLNMRRPLLSLPVEILTQILEEIPAIPTEFASRRWSFPQYWYPRLHDSSLLVPVSRTCRRLRNISLSRNHYWRHIVSTDNAPIPSMLVRSEDSPLSVILDGAAGRTGAEDSRLPAFYPSITPRVRELHFLRVDYDYMKAFKTCLDLVHPELESLSCCGDDPTSALWRRRRLVLDHDHFPRLQHIVLEGITFRVQSPLPSLTHLVLSTITLNDLHVRIANLLLSTPSLISLVLSRLDDRGAIPAAVEPEVPLPHLRRVTLHDLIGRSLRFCLSLTSHCAGEAATQIVNESIQYEGFRFDPVLPDRIKWQSAMMVGVYISHRSPSSGESAQLELPLTHAVTVASPVCALRVAATTSIDVIDQAYWFPGPWLGRILSHRASLENVQEVWLSTSTLSGQHVRPEHGLRVALRDVLAAIPALETVVFSATYGGKKAQEGGGTACPPSLSCLPTILDQSTFNTRKLKTLRIILCDLASLHTHGQSGAEESAPRPRSVDFTWMLEELASSAYCYLETLVLQTTPGFQIRESDLAHLREYFANVSLEEIWEPQRMPLPQCCVEYDDGPGRSRTWREPYMA